MGGGLVLAAVAFVICAFVQIQIQVSSLNSPLPCTSINGYQQIAMVT